MLQGADGPAKDETRAMTAWVRDEILKLLHPFMPFVTEELWRVTAEGGPGPRQPARAGALAGARGLDNPEAEAEIGWVIDLVTAIRSLRAEMNITTADTALVLVGVSAETAARAGRWADIIRAAGAAVRHFARRARPTGRGAADRARRGGGAAAQGVIDFAAERRASRKSWRGCNADIARIDAKLANPDFIARAPEDVVEGEREKREEAATRRLKIIEALERLKGAT